MSTVSLSHLVLPPWHPEAVPSNTVKPKDPFNAKLLTNRRLTPANSPNDVRHLVIDLSGSNLAYVDGQSLGVLPPGTDEAGKPHKLRLYSIASPYVGEPELGKASATATLCVKRLVYTTDAGEEKHGVCSNYLCDLPEGANLHVTGPVGKAFLPPQSPNATLIMVATGTGIAPFRAFLHSRFGRDPWLKGDMHLYFGVQHTPDILYADELAAFAQQAPLAFNLQLAISREQQTPQGQRMYVQHKLAQQAQQVLALLQQPTTTFYICGLKGMETGILEALAQAAEAQGLNWPVLFDELKQQKRWHVEVY